MANNRFQRSFFEGKEAEDEFIKYAEKYGFTTRKSSKDDDCRRHIDFFIKNKEGQEFSIDVKNIKRVSRNGTELQDSLIWVEFLNVQGRDGWLNADADFIAFRLTEGFILVNRKKLLILAEKLVDKNDIVKNSKDALYKGYRRSDRPKELTSIIKLSDIKTIRHRIWN